LNAALKRHDGAGFTRHGRDERLSDGVKPVRFRNADSELGSELAKIVERKFTPQEPAGHTRPCRRRCVTELTRSEPSAARAALPGRP
jgi:hypothetical protein